MTGSLVVVAVLIFLIGAATLVIEARMHRESVTTTCNGRVSHPHKWRWHDVLTLLALIPLLRRRK